MTSDKYFQLSQKRKRRQLLERADSALSRTLESLDYVIGVETHEVYKNWILPKEHDSCFQYFDCWTTLEEAAEKLKLSEAKGKLLIGSGLPYFNVCCSIWNELSKEIISMAPNYSYSFALVADDSKEGIVVGSHVGYLPDEQRTNNDEIVYELISW